MTAPTMLLVHVGDKRIQPVAVEPSFHSFCRLNSGEVTYTHSIPRVSSGHRLEEMDENVGISLIQLRGDGLCFGLSNEGTDLYGVSSCSGFGLSRRFDFGLQGD